MEYRIEDYKDEYLKDVMRLQLKSEDIIELNKLGYKDIPLTLFFCLQYSTINKVLFVENKLCGILGLNIEKQGENGVPWLLTTDDLYKVNFKAIRETRKYIDEFLEITPYLYNIIDKENKKSIKWLKYLGFEFSEYNGDFYKFELRRKKDV